MHPFHDLCRRSLDEIRPQGRYRTFTALRKQAARFPVYVGGGNDPFHEFIHGEG